MDDLGAVSEPSVQTEQEDDKSKLPETDLPQLPDSNPTGRPAEPWKSGLFACCNNPFNGFDIDGSVADDSVLTKSFARDPKKPSSCFSCSSSVGIKGGLTNFRASVFLPPLLFNFSLVTALFPCVTFGQVAEMVDEGNIACCTSITLYMGMCLAIGLGIGLCCKWKYGLCKQTADYRTKLRKKFNLPQSPAPDWAAHLCCHWCALCQEYRELQSRGFDPSLGSFS
ncbi:hypothetical protein Pint_16470 [Pistacia integerrima]|uniref:Uncharacterized protein n=1 Tax=Pistacia integerrima TaxID=434235 RepID=A0ACC0ZBB3_9ROSI|nr:hypothetical protein Pint_16470 [Pistacia integerrima]